MKLTYDNLVQAALDTLPEFKAEYDKQIAEEDIFINDGNHTVFEYVMIPIILEAVKEDDKPLLKRLFDFVEQMSLSDDIHVVEVCDQSILERLNCELDEDTIIHLIGPSTMEGFAAVKQYMY